MIDLGRVQQIINRPHIVDLRDDGWTLMHPPACHPRLFECSANQAAVAALTERPPQAPGRYEVALYGHDDSGEVVFVIGDPAGDIEGVDWNALTAELWAAREARDDLQELYADLDALDLTAASAYKLLGILNRWDQAAGEVAG